MRQRLGRMGAWFVGLGLLLTGSVRPVVAQPQPFPPDVQLAIEQLTTGVIPFDVLRLIADGYLNWGADSGEDGYGLRDNNGTIQFKQEGGSWVSLPASGTFPTGAPYITRTPDADLSNEFALSTLATALLLNTTTTGVPVAYTGTSCTNQVVVALSAVGAATCADVDVTTMLTGIVPVANGGTGLPSGTSGGVLAFTASGTLASSAALTVNRLVIGGGAGAAPTVLGSPGTTTTVLHGNAAGAPTFGAVDLTTDVTDLLPGANGGTGNGFFAVSGPTTALKTFTFPDASATVLTSAAAVTAAQGGTGLSSYTTGDLIQASGATTLAALAATSTGNVLISGGVGTVSSWGKVGLTTHISGTLGATNGGTGLSSYTTGDLLYASSGTTLAVRNAVAVGQVLISQGTSTAPVWSADPQVGTLLVGSALTFSSATPTIASGFGSGAAVTAGTATAFRLDVGTTPGSMGTVGLPTAATGWNCDVTNLTAVVNEDNEVTRMESSTTTSAVFVNQDMAMGSDTNWTDNSILAVNCVAF